MFIVSAEGQAIIDRFDWTTHKVVGGYDTKEKARQVAKHLLALYANGPFKTIYEGENEVLVPEDNTEEMIIRITVV